MNTARIGLFVITLIAAITGVYIVFRVLDERSAPPIVIEDAAATLPVVVDVRGVVESPGVYELPPGARVNDAVAAAGGLADGADLSTLNLARRLRDGEVLIIHELPAAGQTPSAVRVDEAPNEVSSPRININTATAEDLEALPGIGEVTAERIIAHRDQHGPFRSVHDLISVEGISDRTIDGFRDMVTTGP